jgi:hypothetical protein
MTFHEGCASEAVYSRKTRANGICASSEMRLRKKTTRALARVCPYPLAHDTRTRAKSPLFPRGMRGLFPFGCHFPSFSDKPHREGRHGRG